MRSFSEYMFGYAIIFVTLGSFAVAALVAKLSRRRHFPVDPRDLRPRKGRRGLRTSSTLAHPVRPPGHGRRRYQISTKLPY